METIDRALQSRVEALVTRQVEALTACLQFRALEDGRATRAEYDAFIENVARAHLRSPQLVAFLFALAPPVTRQHRLDNLLEELGLDGPAARPHPALLRDLVVGAGLGHRLPALEAQADDEIRRAVGEPLMYGTLREVGLATLAEIVAFELMLARVSKRIAAALARHRGLSDATLTWFTHHAAVDVQHAAQGLADLEAYACYHGMADEEALLLVEATLRGNVFARRYFREAAPAPASA
jgi:pyrroloquinoline quinone (PQQ) biosynthesis protein C